MSGLVAPAMADVALGVGLDVAWKTAVPLAAGILASHLPGTAAARHQRLAAAWATVPVLAAATVLWGGPTAWTDAPTWPVALWASGAVGLLASMGVAVVAVRRLPTTPHSPGVERSAALATPITVGWWRPRIVVPHDFDDWTPLARRAALVHERAHIARRDWLVHMGVWALTCLFWFNPLAWWARRRLARLAEHAADDRVLRSGIPATDYAEQLLSVARSHLPGALAMGRSVTGARIRAVLDERGRTDASRSEGVVLLGVLLMGGTALAPVHAWTDPEPVLDCLPEPAQPVLDPTLFPYLYPGH